MLAVARGFSRHIGQQICIPSVSFRRRTINFLEQASASSRRIEHPQGTIVAPTAKLLRRQPMSDDQPTIPAKPVARGGQNCTPIKPIDTSQPSQTVRSLPTLSRRMKLVLEGFDAAGEPERTRRIGVPFMQCTKKEPRGDAGLGRRFHEANQFHPSANLAPVIGWGHFRSPDDCRCFAACVGYAFTSCPWSVPCRGVLETRPGPPKGAVCAAAAPPRGPLDQ